MEEKETDKSILRRYLDDMYTRDEVRCLLSKLRDSASNEVLGELTNDVWEEAATHDFTTGPEREKYKEEAAQLLKRIEHKKLNCFRRIMKTVVASVAVACLTLGSLNLLNYTNSTQIVYLETSTSYGERRQIQLPDGTLLTLNSCSRIRYPERFIDDERRVELEGEGYFQVYKNELQPFIVNTSRLNVRVLGTHFDVKSYSSDEIVSVDVEDGKVQVDLPEAMMRLQAKEQVIINTVSGEYSKRCEERSVAVWRKGGLRFDSTPIRDVAKELERMYNCRITFAYGQEFNNLISGEHDNKSLEAVLQSMEYTSGIHYKKENNHVLLFK